MPSIIDHPKRYCPVCDNVVRRNFKPGPGGRANASCPRCRSLERHRFFAILLSVLRPTLGDLGVVLEVAPSPETTPRLARLEPRTHMRLDLGADSRLVDVLGSLTELPCRDDAVDLLVCYHVLEHVPDDRAAMREIARVLSPEGIGLLQVPYREGTATDEDPSAGVEERLRRFGQADHVRYYGDDFEDRLVEAGLSIQRITPLSLVGSEMAVWLHLNPGEVVWLVRPLAGAVVPPRGPAEPTDLTRTFDVLLRQLATTRAELRTARGELRRLQNGSAQPPSAPRTFIARARGRVARAIRRR